MAPLAVSVAVCPRQISDMLDVAATVGDALTVTDVVANDVQVPTETNNVYVPAFAAEEFVIVGFCVELVKLFGPFHWYATPPEPVKFIGLPEHTVELGEILALGAGATVALETALLVQP